MIDCPVCFGEGELDMRDTDAYLAKYLPPEVWAGIGPAGVVECDECEGRGKVTDERAREIHAWAVARVDQVLALIAEREAT